MKFLCLFLIFLISDTCFLQPGKADAWKNLQQGDQTAKALLDQMNLKQKEAGAHPFVKPPKVGPFLDS